MDKALEAIEHEQKLYEPLIASSYEKQTYNAFMSAWSDYMMAHATALGLVMEGKAIEARAVMAGEAQTQFDASAARLTALIEQNRINAEAAQATSEAIAASARWWVVALMLGVLGVSGRPGVGGDCRRQPAARPRRLGHRRQRRDAGRDGDRRLARVGGAVALGL